MPTTLEASAKCWLVYIIEASDHSLYTGITTDMLRRWQQHSNGAGAKFFRGRKPLSLKFVESDHTRSTASQREAAIKKLGRQAKLKLINERVNERDSNFDLSLLLRALDAKP